MAEEEKLLQEIKEPKHTDDPHDSVGKESLDGYIEIDIFKPGKNTFGNKVTEKRKVAKMNYSREEGWVEVDAKLPRKK